MGMGPELVLSPSRIMHFLGLEGALASSEHDIRFRYV